MPHLPSPPPSISNKSSPSLQYNDEFSSDPVVTPPTPIKFPSPAADNDTISPLATPLDDASGSPLRPGHQRIRSTLSKTHTAPLTNLQPEPKRTLSGKMKAIRKRIESELNRKRTTSIPMSQQSSQGGKSSRRGGPAPKKGTVAGLKPSPALTVPEGMSVADASQLCAAKRSDCVLVVDEEEGLSGIFTAKDLAFRVTAMSLDPRLTPVSAIMTKNPMVTRDTTSATEALQLMVSKHFRHLPVCNEEGDVVGLLDITKVFNEALAKIDRSSSASNQLAAALAGVQSELGPGMAQNPQAAAMLAYVDSLKEKMALPDLTTVIDTELSPPVVSPRTSVKQAAILMKERKTTAVCVVEPSGPGGANKVVGIFTSKDVVLRVIAAGLDSTICSVVRVMTPHPDTALPSMTVQDALKKMYNGHYLNLPVVEPSGNLLGIVDVLTLTYSTLEQIGGISNQAGTDSEQGGPMWGKFFDSIGGALDDETGSAISGSHKPLSDIRSQTPSRPGNHLRNMSSVASPISEVHPNDSASAVDDTSEIGARNGRASSVAPVLPPIDDGTYTFKFKTPSNRTHRFQARSDILENLRDIVIGKLQSDPFFTHVVESTGASEPDPTDFVLNYIDDEGDLVAMTSDSDVVHAVSVARAQKQDRVQLELTGGKVWQDAIKAAQPPAPASLPTPSASTVTEEPELVKAPTPSQVPSEAVIERLADPEVSPSSEPVLAPPAKVHATSPAATPKELIAGVSNDLLLPASIAFLGLAVIGGIIVTRLSK